MTPVTSEVVIAALKDTAHIEAMISEANTRQFVKGIKKAQQDQRIVKSREG